MDFTRAIGNREAGVPIRVRRDAGEWEVRLHSGNFPMSVMVILGGREAAGFAEAALAMGFHAIVLGKKETDGRDGRDSLKAVIRYIRENETKYFFDPGRLLLVCMNEGIDALERMPEELSRDFQALILNVGQRAGQAVLAEGFRHVFIVCCTRNAAPMVACCKDLFKQGRPYELHVYQNPAHLGVGSKRPFGPLWQRSLYLWLRARGWC